MSAENDGKVSPEARELLSLFTMQLQIQISQVGKDVATQIQSVKDHTDRRLDAMRDETNQNLREIKTTQADQGRRIEEQGRDIVEVKTRLNEGDKRFVDLEKRVGKNEDSGDQNSKGVAYLAGALAAGGAIGGAVSAAVASILK